MEFVNRIKMKEQEATLRAKNFKEVALGYSSEEAKKEASRCLLCKNPQCVEGCPVRVDIPGFISLLRENKIKEAQVKLKSDNVLPAVCGRVCPQETQCEGKCILRHKGEAVSVGALERFIADYQCDETSEKISITDNGKSVAIVGSGPSGLTCAGELRKKGYSVTVFEALHQLGGVLVYGIPEFRLPLEIINKEIKALEAIGVKFSPNFVIGKTITVDELIIEEGFDAVYIATGSGFPSFMGIKGEDLNYVYSANEFLTRVNLMEAYKFPETDTPVKVGKKVAVIGGGNTAMDAARSALRLGTDKVYLVYRRSLNELPAREAEIEHAKEEGIEFMFLTNPIEYIGDEQGNLVKMICQKMALAKADESGRRRPIPVEGSEFELNVDSVIVAIGTKANPIIANTTEGLKTNKWGYIIANAQGRTTKDRVYAGGDIVTGSATVIEAMGAGKDAAYAIDSELK